MLPASFLSRVDVCGESSRVVKQVFAQEDKLCNICASLYLHLFLSLLRLVWLESEWFNNSVSHRLSVYCNGDTSLPKFFLRLEPIMYQGCK